MKITIESTDKIVDLNNGVKARLWEGRTESGIPVQVLVTRIAVPQGHDTTAFETELQYHNPPQVAEQAYDFRLFID